jgi:hypothetical protein
MAAGDATWNPKKGVAYRVTFPILDADGDLVTGATGLDSEISKDGGTFTDCTNEATEIAINSGVYYLDLTATEMSADTVALIIKTTSSGAKTTVLVMYPLETADMPVDVLAISGDATAADNLEAAADGTGYNLGGGLVVAASVTGAVTTTQAFPANFASLGINASGHVSRVTLVDTTTTNTDMRGTDNAALAASWTSTRAGYLDSVLLAQNANQRTVQVTGSSHIAADVHESQPGSIHATTFDAGAIDAAALATDAVAEIVSGVLTTAMTESYRATNAAPTLAQAAFELIAHMGEASISSTTKTLKKLDGSTIAKTYTLDSATTPTSITEAT